MTWNLCCPWCGWYIVVGDRGAHGDDQGAGVEAAELMAEHASTVHQKTWPEFLEDRSRGEQQEVGWGVG